MDKSRGSGKIVAVINSKNMEGIKNSLEKIDLNLYDLIELRLDACQDLDIKKLSKLNFPLPQIFTLRCQHQGGLYRGSEEERIKDLAALIKLEPAYIDLEDSIDQKNLDLLAALAGKSQIILSHHNFIKTPASAREFQVKNTPASACEFQVKKTPCSYLDTKADAEFLSPNLEELLSSMQAKIPDAIYKIACMAKDTIDALRFILFSKKEKEKGKKLIAISMGAAGESSRILAPIIHEGFSYCPLSALDSTAPGQVSASDLINIYNFKKLNSETQVYGLLGDPVSQSLGHFFHNKQNRLNEENAVYIKWKVNESLLQKALALLLDINVKGLSLTMPLKNRALALSEPDEEAELIGALNTLKFFEDKKIKKWLGTNTDGPGALSCLKGLDKLAGKKVLILGAGGAALAIMLYLKKAGAELKVYNRSADKKLPLNIPITPLAEIWNMELEKHDIIINTLPFNQSFPFEELKFQKGTLAFDISYGEQSSFLLQAKKAGSQCLDGREMFFQQAILQREFWGLGWEK